MNLDEALTTIEILKIENKKLQNRVDYLEEVMYDETMENYDEFESYFPEEKYEQEYD